MVSGGWHQPSPPVLLKPKEIGMGKAGVLYRLSDGQINGIIRVSEDADLAHYPENHDTHGLIEVSVEHPIFYEQAKWEIHGGQLVKKVAT